MNKDDLIKLAEALEGMGIEHSYSQQVLDNEDMGALFDHIKLAEQGRRPHRLRYALLGYRAAMEQMKPKLDELACWEGEFSELTLSFADIQALQARVGELETALKELEYEANQDSLRINPTEFYSMVRSKTQKALNPTPPKLEVRHLSRITKRSTCLITEGPEP